MIPNLKNIVTNTNIHDHTHDIPRIMLAISNVGIRLLLDIYSSNISNMPMIWTIMDVIWYHNMDYQYIPYRIAITNTNSDIGNNVVKTIINHPPVITMFIGGMVTIPSHG